MIPALAAKEFKALFSSPLAWTVLAVLQLALAWIFLTRLNWFLGIQSQLVRIPDAPGFTELVVAPLFGSAALLLLMVVPLLTMRLIAEERRNQTLPFLMSAPLSMGQIVLGKFLGLMAFLALPIGLATAMAVSLSAGGPLDWGLLAANAIGLVLLVTCFCSLGLYLSCLTAHPALAAVGSLGAAVALWILDLGAESPWLRALSLLRRFESFNKGVIDSYDAAYMLIFGAVFLALAARRLDAERLRG